MQIELYKSHIRWGKPRKNRKKKRKQEIGKPEHHAKTIQLADMFRNVWKGKENCYYFLV